MYLKGVKYFNTCTYEHAIGGDFVKKVNIYLRGNNKETIGPLQCEGKSNISKIL